MGLLNLVLLAGAALVVADKLTSSNQAVTEATYLRTDQTSDYDSGRRLQDDEGGSTIGSSTTGSSTTGDMSTGDSSTGSSTTGSSTSGSTTTSTTGHGGGMGGYNPEQPYGGSSDKDNGMGGMGGMPGDYYDGRDPTWGNEDAGGFGGMGGMGGSLGSDDTMLGGMNDPFGNMDPFGNLFAGGGAIDPELLDAVRNDPFAGNFEPEFDMANMDEAITANLEHLSSMDPRGMMMDGTSKVPIVLDEEGLPPLGSVFGNPSVIYAPLDVGAELMPGASWGTAVPQSTKSLPGGSRSGTAGKTNGKNGLPVGIPSSAATGLAAPQSAEVAAAAAASQSLEPAVRKTVASVKPSSGSELSFTAAGTKGKFNSVSVRKALAKKLGVPFAAVSLSIDDGAAPGTTAAGGASSRRRMNTGSEGSLAVKAYVTTTKSSQLQAAMKEAASDTANLSASLNITVTSATEPSILQVSSDGTQLVYHPWHLTYVLPYEYLLAVLIGVLILAYYLTVVLDICHSKFILEKQAMPQQAAESMEEEWAFDESAYSFYLAALLHGSPAIAAQGFCYIAFCVTVQVAFLRIYSIGDWANGVQNSNGKGDGAFVDIMYASGDTGEMLAARTACNIVCGAYVLLSLGNSIFNALRVFMCITAVAFLRFQRGVSNVVARVEEPDASREASPAPSPSFPALAFAMAFAWVQLSIAVGVGTVCMQIIAESDTIADIIMNFLALLFIAQVADEIMAARVINAQGAMGGKIVPVLKIEWQQEIVSTRCSLMPVQKFLVQMIVTASHFVVIALVDVNSFVVNKTYAGGNMVAFTVGWSATAIIIIAVDHFKPSFLARIQATYGRLLLTLVVFELVGLFLQGKTSSQLTSGNTWTSETIRAWIRKGSQFAYFLSAAYGHAERGSGNDVSVAGALTLCFLSTHLGRMFMPWR